MAAYAVRLGALTAAARLATAAEHRGLRGLTSLEHDVCPADDDG
jgi:hypothetical protein